MLFLLLLFVVDALFFFFFFLLFRRIVVSEVQGFPYSVGSVEFIFIFTFSIVCAASRGCGYVTELVTRRSFPRLTVEVFLQFYRV